MALPASYLTSFKNAPGILQAIQAAQAPPRFTQKFLEGLGFPNSNDRMIINVLKSLRFLDDTGVPTKRYHEYLDQTQAAGILADGLREAYADLFRINRNAQDMGVNEVKNKMKTLSEGQFTDRVLTQMAGTFNTLAKLADFSGDNASIADDVSGELREPDETPAPELRPHYGPSLPRIGGLVYSINLHLPESRDQAVYDALFRSLKEHLL